jgi:hypothetical protein
MRIRTVAYLSIAVLAHAVAARGQDLDLEPGTNEYDHWIPSIGLSIGIVRQSASAIQQNNLRPPDDTFPPPGPFPGTPSDGDDSLIDPLSVLTAELMTPGIGSVPTRPRLFVHGEFGGAFGSTSSLAREGTPKGFELPPDPVVPTAPVPGLAVGGQGTLTEMEISTLIGGAGAGVAFTVDLFGRRLRLKPSFEYLLHGVEVTGVVQHAAGQRAIDISGNIVEDWSFTSFNKEKEKTLHSVGGGLELEMDTLRAGPFMVALFANGQAYRLLGDSDIRLVASDGTNTATWDVTLDREIYRASAGLRFRFFPEE